MNRLAVMAGLALAGAIRRAHAQQDRKVYRIAVVHPSAPVSAMSETEGFRDFFQRLRQHGYIEGQNLAVEWYSGEGRAEHFAELIRDVVRSNPDVIYVVADRLARELKPATDIIPVVIAVSDPVAIGVVSNVARPGGDITGVMIDADPVGTFGRRLQFLREMIPTASKVGYLASRAIWEHPITPALVETAQSMKISLVGPPLAAPFNEAEYRRVFAAMAGAGTEGLMVSAQPEHSTNGRLIVELAAEYRLPASYWYREFADIGGLMVYGIDRPDISRHAADQVDMILKVAKPGEIPFYQPTKFPLVINLETVKALGITVPPTLLIAADEVIE